MISSDEDPRMSVFRKLDGAPTRFATECNKFKGLSDESHILPEIRPRGRYFVAMTLRNAGIRPEGIYISIFDRIARTIR